MGRLTNQVLECHRPSLAGHRDIHIGIISGLQLQATIPYDGRSMLLVTTVVQTIPANYPGGLDYRTWAMS